MKKNPVHFGHQGLKLFVTILFLLSHGYLLGKDFYVSTSGTNKNPGTANRPFASLEYAVESVVKDIRLNKGVDYTIHVGEGLHFQNSTLKIDAQQLSGAKLVIKGNGMNKSILSGGKALRGWKLVKPNVWSISLPKNMDSNRELFIDGKRAQRARHPNTGYLRVKKTGEDRRTNFTFHKNDFPIPAGVDGVEVVLLHDWSISRNEIKDIKIPDNRITTRDSIGATSPGFFHIDNWEKDPRYYLENAPEFMDMDYEWYVDNLSNMIYLQLPDGKHPENMEIIVPALEGLVKLKGTADLAIQNIHFEDLSFRHCRWVIPEKGYGGVQACFHDARPDEGWTAIPAAIQLKWANNCSFRNCEISRLGTSGIWIGEGSRSCEISGTSVYDVSGNGIMIGEGRERMVEGQVWWKSAPEEVASGNTVRNSIVNQVGQQFYGAVGIWCGFVAETEISDNEIFDLPYTGISIGWEWSPVPTPCRANRVEGNHIYNILEILSDGGGIYMLGLQPGSRLVNNHIHDVKVNAGRAESNGMFLDEGTTDVVVANNLIYNIAKSPLRFHKATTNLVKDNYLFCANENPPIRYNNTKAEDITKKDNIVYSEGEEEYGQMLQRAISDFKK